MTAAPRRPDRGFALLIVLWMLVLTALIAARVTAAGRSEAQLAGNLRAAAVLEAAADGAVQEAAFRMLDPGRGGWRADGTVRRLTLPGAAVAVELRDQAGKLNPNLASPELLAALLRQVGADALRADAVAAAILDWRFPGASARRGGAKAAEYRAAGRNYGPPEAPFRSVAELGSVLGMTPDLLERVSPYLSVFPQGDPDPGLAEPPVLAALRSIAGGGLLAPLARTGPRVVAVTATAGVPGGNAFVRRAVVRIGAATDDQPLRILSWERGDG